jgi:hypothetical protein
MDGALDVSGVRSRSGDPRTMVSLRLRAHEKLRRTAAEYAEASEHDTPASGDASSPSGSDDEQDSPPAPLPVTLARAHLRATIEEVAAAELDPEAYLRAFIISSDPIVTTRDRLRARRMLTRREADTALVCVCIATLMARDELELRNWIDQYREQVGAEVSKYDTGDAAIVRHLAQGDRSMLHGPNWQKYQSAAKALDAVVRLGVARARGEAIRARDTRDTYEGDSAVAPFWRLVLSPDETVAPRERLNAFTALEEMSALPSCSCDRKKGTEGGDWVAHTIHLVAQKHYRAVPLIAQNPETYLAVRDAVDAAILEDRILSEERASAAAGAGVANATLEDTCASEAPTTASREPEHTNASNERLCAAAEADNPVASDDQTNATPEAAVADLGLQKADDPKVLYPRRPHPRFTDEEMAVSILLAWRDLGRPLMGPDQPFTGLRYESWRSAKPKDERRSLPTLAAIKRTFGGWEEALQFAATPPPASAGRAGSVTRRSSFSTAKSSAAAIAG